jgi:hypothetical protein
MDVEISDLQRLKRKIIKVDNLDEVPGAHSVDDG